MKSRLKTIFCKGPQGRKFSLVFKQSTILNIIPCPPSTEAEFLDVIGTKNVRVFLLVIHSHRDFTRPPLEQKLKLVCNVNTVYTENSSLRTLKIMPRNLNEIVCSLIRFKGRVRALHRQCGEWRDALPGILRPYYTKSRIHPQKAGKLLQKEEEQNFLWRMRATFPNSAVDCRVYTVHSMISPSPNSPPNILLSSISPWKPFLWFVLCFSMHSSATILVILPWSCVQMHRMIRLIEGNAKCRHLKNWPIKGLCGRCLSVWGPEPHAHPPLHTVYLYTHYTGKGEGGETWTRKKGRWATA